MKRRRSIRGEPEAAAPEATAPEATAPEGSLPVAHVANDAVDAGLWDWSASTEEEVQRALSDYVVLGVKSDGSRQFVSLKELDVKEGSTFESFCAYGGLVAEPEALRQGPPREETTFSTQESMAAAATATAAPVAAAAKAAGSKFETREVLPIEMARKIVDGLLADDESLPFAEPVDAEGLGLADYFDVVKQPMDLGTIKQGLVTGDYLPQFSVVVAAAEAAPHAKAEKGSSSAVPASNGSNSKKSKTGTKQTPKKAKPSASKSSSKSSKRKGSRRASRIASEDDMLLDEVEEADESDGALLKTKSKGRAARSSSSPTSSSGADAILSAYPGLEGWVDAEKLNTHLKLVFSNCIAYNQNGSPIVASARLMMEHRSRLWYRHGSKNTVTINIQGNVLDNAAVASLQAAAAQAVASLVPSGSSALAQRVYIPNVVDYMIEYGVGGASHSLWLVAEPKEEEQVELLEETSDRRSGRGRSRSDKGGSNNKKKKPTTKVATPVEEPKCTFYYRIACVSYNNEYVPKLEPAASYAYYSEQTVANFHFCARLVHELRQRLQLKDSILDSVESPSATLLKAAVWCNEVGAPLRPNTVSFLRQNGTFIEEQVASVGPHLTKAYGVVDFLRKMPELDDDYLNALFPLPEPATVSAPALFDEELFRKQFTTTSSSGGHGNSNDDRMLLGISSEATSSTSNASSSSTADGLHKQERSTTETIVNGSNETATSARAEDYGYINLGTEVDADAERGTIKRGYELPKPQLYSFLVDPIASAKALDELPKVMSDKPKINSASVAGAPTVPTAVPTAAEQGNVTSAKLMAPTKQGQDLLGARVEMLWPDDGVWYPATVVRYRPKTELHLLQYDDRNELEWCDLNSGSTLECTWRFIPGYQNKTQHTFDSHNLVGVMPCQHGPIEKICVPPSLLGPITRVYIFFQCFAEQLGWNIRPFSLAEFAAAVLSKSVRTNRAKEPQSIAAELLLCINLELLNLVMSEHIEDSEAFAQFKRTHKDVEIPKPVTVLPPTSSDEGSIVRWAFDQVGRAVQDISVLALMDRDKEGRRFSDGASWQDLKNEVHDMMRDPGWFATRPEFLESICRFYVEVVKWKPNCAPRLQGIPINLYTLYTLVKARGGFRVIESRQTSDEIWKQIADQLPNFSDDEIDEEIIGPDLRDIYSRYLLLYERAYLGHAAHAKLRMGSKVLLRNGESTDGAPIGLSLLAPNPLEGLPTHSTCYVAAAHASVNDDADDDADEDIQAGVASSTTQGAKKTSPYFFFAREQWDNSMSFADCSRLLTNRWKTMSDTEKSKYVRMAAVEDEEVDDVVSSQRKVANNKLFPKRKREKVRKKGRTAFTFFVSEVLKGAHQESHPGEKDRTIVKSVFTEIAKVSADKWKLMSEEERAPYRELAREDALVVEEAHRRRAELEARQNRARTGYTPPNIPSINTTIATRGAPVFTAQPDTHFRLVSSTPVFLPANPVLHSLQLQSKKPSDEHFNVKPARVGLNFFSMNDWTWQEFLVEVFCRMEGIENPRSSAAHRKPRKSHQEEKKDDDDHMEDEDTHGASNKSPTNSDPGEELETSSLKQNKDQDESTDSAAEDAGEYDLKEEEAKEDQFWEIAPPSIAGQDSSASLFVEEESEVEDEAGVVDECERLLEALISHPLAAPFVEPIEPSQPGMRNYARVVAEPISLSEILERLRAGFYQCDAETMELEAFVSDLRMVWSNGMKFYKQGSEVYDDIQHLSTLADERLEGILEMDRATEHETSKKLDKFVDRLIQLSDDQQRSVYESILSKFPISHGPGPKSSKRKPHEELKRLRLRYPRKVVGRYALNVISRDEDAEAFLEPVDTSLRGLEDYEEIIKRPMDLGTISRRLEDGFYDYYASADRSTLAPKFLRDVKLVFNNCIEYNGETSGIGRAADRLFDLFQKLLLAGKAPGYSAMETMPVVGSKQSMSATGEVLRPVKRVLFGVCEVIQPEDDQHVSHAINYAVSSTEKPKMVSSSSSVPVTSNSNGVSNQQKPIDDTPNEDAVMTEASKDKSNSENSKTAAEVTATPIPEDQVSNPRGEPAVTLNEDSKAQPKVHSSAPVTEASISPTGDEAKDPESNSDPLDEPLPPRESFPDVCEHLLDEVTELRVYKKTMESSGVGAELEEARRKLKGGEYSLNEVGEIGNDFIRDIRAMLSKWHASVTSPNDKTAVSELTEQLEQNYAIGLRDNATSKWAWVGEKILWLDVRVQPPIIKQAQIQDYYAPPKYRYKHMRSKTDFYRLRVQVETEPNMMPLNLWTDQTIAHRLTKGLNSYANSYGVHWTFSSDKEASEALVDANALSDVDAHEVDDAALDLDDLEDEENEDDDDDDDDNGEENEDDEDAANTQTSSALKGSENDVRETSSSSSEALPLGQKVVSEMLEFWSPEDMPSVEVSMSPKELLNEILSNDYASLTPHVKLCILERLCEHVVNTFPVRVGIAMAMGIRKPERFDLGPKEESELILRGRRSRVRSRKADDADSEDGNFTISGVAATVPESASKRQTRGKRVKYQELEDLDDALGIEEEESEPEEQKETKQSRSRSSRTRSKTEDVPEEDSVENPTPQTRGSKGKPQKSTDSSAKAEVTEDIIATPRHNTRSRRSSRTRTLKLENDVLAQDGEDEPEKAEVDETPAAASAHQSRRSTRNSRSAPPSSSRRKSAATVAEDEVEEAPVRRGRGGLRKTPVAKTSVKGVEEKENESADEQLDESEFDAMDVEDKTPARSTRRSARTRGSSKNKRAASATPARRGRSQKQAEESEDEVLLEDEVDADGIQEEDEEEYEEGEHGRSKTRSSRRSSAVSRRQSARTRRKTELFVAEPHSYTKTKSGEELRRSSRKSARGQKRGRFADVDSNDEIMSIDEDDTIDPEILIAIQQKDSLQEIMQTYVLQESESLLKAEIDLEVAAWQPQRSFLKVADFDASRTLNEDHTIQSDRDHVNVTVAKETAVESNDGTAVASQDKDAEIEPNAVAIPEGETMASSSSSSSSSSQVLEPKKISEGDSTSVRNNEDADTMVVDEVGESARPSSTTSSAIPETSGSLDSEIKPAEDITEHDGKLEKENIITEASTLVPDQDSSSKIVGKTQEPNGDAEAPNAVIEPFVMDFEKCKTQFASLLKDRISQLFRNPVDTSAPGYENYSKLVSNPMDLNSVMENLEDGEYEGQDANGDPVVVGSFLRDCELVFLNAGLFFAKDSKEFKQAEKCETKLNSLLGLENSPHILQGITKSLRKLRFLRGSQELFDELMEGHAEIVARLEALDSAESDTFQSVLGNEKLTFNIIRSRIISGEYERDAEASFRRTQRKGSGGTANPKQRGLGFARDMRTIITAYLAVFNPISLEAEQINGLSIAFERGFAPLLHDLSVSRMVWLGERIFVANQLRGLVPALVAGSAYSNSTLAFRVLMHPAQERTMCLWTPETLQDYELELGRMNISKGAKQRSRAALDVSALPRSMYGVDWVFAEDFEFVTALEAKLMTRSSEPSTLQKKNVMKLGASLRSDVRQLDAKRKEVLNAEVAAGKKILSKLQPSSNPDANGEAAPTARRRARKMKIITGDVSLSSNPIRSSLGTIPILDILRSSKDTVPGVVRALEKEVYLMLRSKRAPQLTEELKKDDLDTAVGLPDDLPKGIRFEPLGYDRNGSTYWYFSMGSSEAAAEIGSFVFVCLSIEGQEKLEQDLLSMQGQAASIFPTSSADSIGQQGLWLMYSSRAQIEALLAALFKGPEEEKRVYDALLGHYKTMIASMWRSGTEYMALPFTSSRSESARVRVFEINNKPDIAVHLSSTPLSFGGAPLIVNICERTPVAREVKNASAGTRNLSELHSARKAQATPLRVGDVLMSIGDFSCAGMSPEEAASTWARVTSQTSSEPIRVTIYRPKEEAAQQALAFCRDGDGAVAKYAPQQLVRCVVPVVVANHSAMIDLVLALEAHLWSMGAAEPRILSVVEEWRWLHNWGQWKWPSRRSSWHRRVSDLGKDIDLGKTSGQDATNLVAAALRSICRAYVSTMPPVYGSIVYSDPGRIDSAAESLLQRSRDLSVYTFDYSRPSFKISSAIYGLPVEAEWLRELNSVESLSHLSLLASWLYIESVARFTSATLVADLLQTRSLQFERLKTSTSRRLRKYRITTTQPWQRLFYKQLMIREKLRERLSPDELAQVRDIESGLSVVPGTGLPPKYREKRRRRKRGSLAAGESIESRTKLNGSVLVLSQEHEQKVGSKRKRPTSVMDNDPSEAKQARITQEDANPEDPKSAISSITPVPTASSAPSSTPAPAVSETPVIDSEVVKSLQSIKERVSCADDIDSETEDEIRDLLSQKPKRRSAWLMFVVDERQRLHQPDGTNYMTLDITHTTRVLRDKWRGLSESERQAWQQSAEDYNKASRKIFDQFQKLGKMAEQARLAKRSGHRPRRSTKPVHLLEKTKVFTSTEAKTDDMVQTKTKEYKSHKSSGQQSEFQGLSRSRGRWKVDILCPDGMIRQVGRFDHEVAAAVAYDMGLRMLYPLRVAEALANFPFEDIVKALEGHLPDIADFEIRVHRGVEAAEARRENGDGAEEVDDDDDEDEDDEDEEEEEDDDENDNELLDEDNQK